MAALPSQPLRGLAVLHIEDELSRGRQVDLRQMIRIHLSYRRPRARLLLGNP